MGKSGPSMRAKAVQRVLDGESQIDVARSYDVPRATLRTWVHRHKSQSQPRAAPAIMPEVIAPPSVGLTRMERMYEQLEGVDADIKQSRDLEKVSPLAGLQALRARVVLQICDLEEAAEVERKRQGLTRGQRQIVDGVISKLAAMPSVELEAILAGLQLRREQKGIGDSTNNRKA